MAETPEQSAPLLSLRAALAVGLLSLAAAAAVAELLRLAILPLGTRNWSWVQRTEPREHNSVALLVACLAMLVLSLLVFEWVRAPRPPSRRTCTGLLLILLPLSLSLAGAIALTDRFFPLEAPLVVLSDVATGYYGAAAQALGPAEVLAQDYQRVGDASLPDRVRTHPPGPILFMLALRDLALAHPGVLPYLQRFLWQAYGLRPENLLSLARSGTTRALSTADALIACPVAWLLTLLPALIFLPAYGLGAVLADRRVGLAAAALSLALPALWCFLPGIDGLGAVLALTAIYLWAAALRGGSWWRYALAGLGAAVALFWSYGYLALAPVAFFLAWSRGRGDRPRNLASGLVFAVAVFAVIYGLLDLACGYNLWASLQASLAVQRDIMVREQRDYLTWLGLNPYAFLVFLGPALWPGLVASWISRRMQQGAVARLTLGTLLTLVALVLLGSTRGEVERIWVFLMPLLAVSLAALLTRLPRQVALWLPAAILLTQLAFTIFLLETFTLVTVS
jgi:hypothetical protein